MRDFIGHNAMFFLEWGQLIIGIVIIICLGVIHAIGKNNIYHLPKGLLGWSIAILSFIVVSFSALAFVGITIEKKTTGIILHQFEDLKGKKAPFISFNLVSDNSEHGLEEYYGKVILVNIWATWCAPCIKELPDLNQLYNYYKDEELVIIALSDESRDKILDFSKRYPFDCISGYVNGFDWFSGDVGTARPVTFLIDKEGIIQDYFTGAYNYDFFESKVKNYF